MNVTRDPESILSAWLDEGPTDLPDATRRAILSALPTTPQARRGHLAPWRFSMMNATTRLAAAALVAVVAIGGAIYLIGPRSGAGGPTPIPSATPGSTPVATSDRSTVDRRQAAGYTMAVPATWHWQIVENSVFFSTPAPLTSAQLWEGDPVTGAGVEYAIPEGGAIVGNATFRGHDVAELLASINAFYTTYYTSRAVNEHATTVDGEQATQVEHTTAGPELLYIDAVVIHGSRAYNFTVTASPSNAAELRAAFDEVLASIRWTT